MLIENSKQKNQFNHHLFKQLKVLKFKQKIMSNKRNFKFRILLIKIFFSMMGLKFNLKPDKLSNWVKLTFSRTRKYPTLLNQDRILESIKVTQFWWMHIQFNRKLFLQMTLLSSNLKSCAVLSADKLLTTVACNAWVNLQKVIKRSLHLNLKLNRL
jgi:hypothetical protein